MLITLSLLWGGSFFFVEVVITELPSLTTVFLRVLIAALALWIYAAFKGLYPPNNAKIWGMVFIMGFLNNVVPFTLIAWGQLYITSGYASILNATTPLFTVIIAGMVLADERMTPMKILGVSVGLVGVILMVGPSSFEGLVLENISSEGISLPILAQFAVLIAAIFYAFAGVFGRGFSALGVDPIITAAGQVTASAILLVPLVLVIDQPLTLPFPSRYTVLSILGLAVLSTAVAYILYFKLLATAGATNLLLVTFLIPVSAILLGILILGEQLELMHVLGMLLIGGGLSAIDGRLWKRKNAS